METADDSGRFFQISTSILLQVGFPFKMIVINSDSWIPYTVPGTFLLNFVCAFTGKIIKIFPKILLFSKVQLVALVA